MNRNCIGACSLGFALMLSACSTSPDAGGRVIKTGLPHSDSFRVQRSQSPEYDFLVTIKNGKDLGINADNQLARDRMALLAMKGQCEAPQIIREVAVDSGSGFFGEGSGRTYELHVKC